MGFSFSSDPLSFIENIKLTLPYESGPLHRTVEELDLQWEAFSITKTR